MIEDEPDKKLEQLRSHLSEVVSGIELASQSPMSVATLEDIKSERETRQYIQDLQILRNRLIDLINDRQHFLKERKEAALKDVAIARVDEARADLEGICEEMDKLINRHKQLMGQALSISKSMEVDFNTAYPDPKSLPLMVSVDPTYLRGFAPKTTVIYQSNTPHKFYIRMEALTNA